MDAEGLGRGLLLTPLRTHRKSTEKQTVGTVAASHKVLTLQALSSSLNAGTAKRGLWGQGKAFGWPPAVCPPKRPRPFARCRLNHFVLITVCSAEFFVVRLGICTGFKWVSFRETHLWEHFGRTDQIAPITCLKKLNVSGASLSFEAKKGKGGTERKGRPKLVVFFWSKCALLPQFEPKNA